MSIARAPIEIETLPNPTFSVIWLHGLGADGSDFVPVVDELGLSPSAAVRFIFPTAPHIPVTVNGGYLMPAWYDILGMGALNRQVDVNGILKSREMVRALIAQEEARGIDSSHIVIAGFSQGGAIAYSTAFTHAKKLGGVLALSTYIPDAPLLEKEFQACNRTTPLFIGHGQYDGVVSPQMGEQAREKLVELGCEPEWHIYPMEHSVCLEEIKDISQWLNAIIANA